MARSYIAGPGEMSLPFLLDENPLLYRADSAGEQSIGAPKVSYRAACSNSERAAPSACFGKRFCFVQIVWNKSTQCAGARGDARVGGLVRSDGWNLDDHRRIFDRGDDFQGAAAVGAVLHVDVETRLSSRAKLMRGVSP